MKKSKLLGWVLMALVTVSSCTNDAIEIFTQGNEIKLTSEITPSRVASLDYQSIQIVEGQEVGVTITGVKSGQNNVPWSVGDNGALSNTGEAVYFGDGAATITAYHPYNDEWDENKIYAFSVNTDQSSEVNYRNSDLRWVTTTFSMTETAIPLNFSHKLTKINVILTSDDIKDLSNAEIFICGTNISTDFNPITGDLSATTNNITEIKASVTTYTAYTGSAIIVPQAVKKGTQIIKILYKNRSFHYTLPEDMEYKSGHSYNYTLQIKDSNMENPIEGEESEW